MDGRKLVLHVEKSVKSTNQEYGSIQDLQNILGDNTYAIDWLNRVCKFLYKHELYDVIRECSIILDQAGFLDKLSELYRDQGIAEELKDIAEDLLQWKIRQELRDTRLTAIGSEVGAGDRDTAYVSAELIRKLRDRSKTNPDADFERASVRFFSWIVEQEHWSLLRDFPAFSVESDSGTREIIKLESESESESRPLAPVLAWETDLCKFAELFPKRYVLADAFFESTPDPTVWQTLVEKGFLRRNVLVVSDKHLRRFLPSEPLSEEEEHRTSAQVTATRVAFMIKEDIGIMARVRQSQRLARLFWRFLIEWLIPRDTAGLEATEALCDCGNKHDYYPPSG